MTTLEMILINYILLNWFVTIMFMILPRRISKKVYLLYIIVCPPLIIGVIVEGIIENHNKRKNTKEQKEEELW